MPVKFNVSNRMDNKQFAKELEKGNFSISWGFVGAWFIKPDMEGFDKSNPYNLQYVARITLPSSVPQLIEKLQILVQK